MLREPTVLPGPELQQPGLPVLREPVRPAWGRDAARDAVRRALLPTATVRLALLRALPLRRRTRAWFLHHRQTGMIPADDVRRAPPLWMTQTLRTRPAL